MDLKEIFLNSIVLALLMIFIGTDADETVEDTFFVKPGGETLSVEAHLDKYTCKFTYVANGGTHEAWTVLMLLDKETSITCTVERPSSSYLFFDSFKMELIGPSVSISEVDLINSKSDNLRLKSEEYVLEANSVSSVAGKFSNHLEKVAVFSPIPREEL